jgi:hypothetical protein
LSRGLLARAPTSSDLERLYFELAKRGAPSVGRESPWPYEARSREHLLALAAEMLRYDPRLLSILLQWTLAEWRTLDLQQLRRELRAMRWPQAMLVLWTFVREAERDDTELGYVVDYLRAGYERVSPPERFFLDVEQPDSRRAQQRLGRSLRPYSRWGFIGTERPTVDAFTKRVVGSYDDATRRRIAVELAQRRGGVISMREYLDAVDHSIGRGQAVKDLHAAGLRPSRGRGASWRLPGTKRR